MLRSDPRPEWETADELRYILQVKAVEEEEDCLIPMGGVLPRVPQRVLGIGGTGGMVHPSTGLF